MKNGSDLSGDESWRLTPGRRLVSTLAFIASVPVVAASPLSRLPAAAPELAGLERALSGQDFTPFLDGARPSVVSIRRTLEQGFEPGTAVLVYRFTSRSLDKGSLKAWLLDETGLRASGECPMNPRGIARLLGRLHRAIGAELPGGESRGVAPVGTGHSEPDTSVADRAGAALASCLFPGKIANKLSDVNRLAIVPTHFLGSSCSPFSRPRGPNHLWPPRRCP